MVTSSILIRQVGDATPWDRPGISRSNLGLENLITLTNFNNAGVTSWHWELISRPPLSTVGDVAGSHPFVGHNASSATFTPDVSGSYLIQLTVNNHIVSRVIAAVLTGTVRYPAARETNEFAPTDGYGYGWEKAILDVFANLDTGSRYPTGPAGGDLTGTYPSPVVSKLLGQSLSVTPPINGQVLAWSSSGNAWTPTTPSLTGVASGDLYGTYPSPTVNKLQGRLISAAVPVDGGSLIWNEGAAQWICSNPTPGGEATGDLTGYYPAPVVSGIRGYPVAAVEPSINQVLKWTGAQWTPSAAVGTLERILVFSDDTEFSTTGKPWSVKKTFRIVRDAANPPILWRVVISAWIDVGSDPNSETQIRVTAAYGVGVGDSVTMTTASAVETLLFGHIDITEAMEPTDQLLTFTISLRTTGDATTTAHLQYTDIYGVW